MKRQSLLPEKARLAGITVYHNFAPGGSWLVNLYIHGVQNFKNYGFNQIHEAYCAQIATDFILNPDPKRSRVWITKEKKEWMAQF